jgi:hypothetical protein
MNPSTKRSTPAAPLSAAAGGGPCPALPTSSNGPPKPTAEHASQASFVPGVPGAIVVDTTTLTTDVVAVHPSSREVVLGGPGGKPFAVACGPEVRNFDQIHVGDRVEAVVTKEFAYAMASESDPPDTGGSSVITLSPRGAQPGAVMAKVKQVTAAVIAIDLEHHKATLEFPGGQTQTVEVRPDVDLSERKVGEKVVIRLTDSVALRVEKPQQQPQ